MFAMQLSRTTFGPMATLGKLTINGVFECYTLEDTVREVPNTPVASWKIPGQTAIPFGTYDVDLGYSPKFNRVMPKLLNVPGFTGILMHMGNTDKDTEGCILLGQGIINPDFIANSLLAFNAFYNKIQAAIDNGDLPTITIKHG